MEALINEAFLHVDIICQYVHEGQYDLVGSDGAIILPGNWDHELADKRDHSITMHLWPIPDPSKSGSRWTKKSKTLGSDGKQLLPPLVERQKKMKKKKKPVPTGFLMWTAAGMGANRKKALKQKKD